MKDSLFCLCPLRIPVKHVLLGLCICALVPMSDRESWAADSGQIYCNNPNIPSDKEWPGGAYANLLDWDGDGKMDIVRGTAYRGAYLYLNIGTGKNPPLSYKFAEPREIFPKRAIGSRVLKPIDWNGDSKWDMIFSERVKTNGLDYFINTGTNAQPVWIHKALIPSSTSHLSFPSRHMKFLEVVDWDGDGKFDLLVGAPDPHYLHIRTAEHIHGDLFFCKNTGKKNTPFFAQPVRLETGAKSIFGRPKPAAGDMDGDGDLDIICGTSSPDLLYFENIGSRREPKLAFARVLLSATESPISMGDKPNVYDLDSDGDTDLLISGQFYENQSTNGVLKLVHRGALTYEPPGGMSVDPRTLVSVEGTYPTVVDWDGDGDDDIICGNEPGVITLYENIGRDEAGRIFKPSRRLKADGKPIWVASGSEGSLAWGPAEQHSDRTCSNVCDWDGDGDLDIITVGFSGQVLWFENAGTRKAPVLMGIRPVDEAGGLWLLQRSRPGCVDWNGDGKIDVVGPDSKTHAITLYEQKEFESKKVLRACLQFKDAAGNPVLPNNAVGAEAGRTNYDVGDWDDDGDYDIVIGASRAMMKGQLIGDILFYENIGTNLSPVLYGHVLIADCERSKHHSIGLCMYDWNGDGTRDILYRADNAPGLCWYDGKMFSDIRYKGKAVDAKKPFRGEGQ